MGLRAKVLELLRSADGAISGEDIAEKLGVSRTAIWKHIKELKATGYEIESHARSGYRLYKAPDHLTAEELAPHLKTRYMGRQLAYFDETQSTNQQLKALATAGAEEGMVAVAEMQTDGHGRLSRGWFCPKGKGLLFSLLLRPEFILPQEAPKFTLLAAVAVVRAIKKQGVNVGIKWPNDVLADGKKLVGILTEMSAEMERIHHIVIGIGINVNIEQEEFSPEVQDIATSISILKGEQISRVAFFADILLAMEELYETVRREGFAPVLAEWKEKSITLGQDVRVLGGKETFVGRAVDIDDYGALLIDTETGQRRVLAGDVSIRPQKSK